jgi:hypothetical protein
VVIAKHDPHDFQQTKPQNQLLPIHVPEKSNKFETLH